MASSLRTVLLPRPTCLRPLLQQIRGVSNRAALTKLLLPVNEGIEEDARRELRWMSEEIQRIVDLGGTMQEIHQEKRLEEMVRERAGGKPLQYVLGNQPFGSLLINVRPPILIPRPETDDWASKLASLLLPSLSNSTRPSASAAAEPPLELLDLCTGTGCIPLLLCASLPPGTIRATGVDVLADAVELARENAAANGIELVGTSKRGGNTFEVLQRDIFADGFLEEMLGAGDGRRRRNPDVLTSNPPYIPLKEMESLDRSVTEYESHLALVGDVPHLLPLSFYPPTLSHLHRNRGLDFYLLISYLVSRGLVRSPAPASPRQIDPRPPQIVLEVGHDQAAEVEDVLMKGPAAERMERVERWVDWGGKERVVVGWLKEKEE
ncbi:S-adenosyl-L-methionine-dependent methyltransferase [Mrakia frigida]|uniref:S-adenosylmethionine-dependent methyltransferase n=1 Tax=Mrakia frigida TaxID=29902 RepID=UPI003FCC05E4